MELVAIVGGILLFILAGFIAWQDGVIQNMKDDQDALMESLKWYKDRYPL